MSKQKLNLGDKLPFNTFKLETLLQMELLLPVGPATATVVSQKLVYLKVFTLKPWNRGQKPICLLTLGPSEIKRRHRRGEEENQSEEDGNITSLFQNSAGWSSTRSSSAAL